MLQAIDIDFLVLEAYPTVAAQVGAGIGLLPHGNRILDQLGLYKKVMEIAPPIQAFNFRDTDGQILAQHREMDERIIERHGYPIFLDRQMLLKMVYNNIKDKSKILTNKRVVRTELVSGGVQAGTSDGTSIPGDILVEQTTCTVKNSSSYLVTGGPQGRVYWFRFQKLQEKVHGSAIPRYSEKDLQKALSESAGDNILPDLKFSTLIDNKVSAVMTPLVEYVYKQWHFDRIITLGDSAHKFHPVGGQGGNAAIESVALLTNDLVKALERSRLGRLTTVQVESMFADVQSRRKPSLALNHRYSHDRANTEAIDTPLKKLMAIHLLPLVGEQVVTLGYCSHPGGEMMDMLPMQHLIAASAGKYYTTSIDRSVPHDYWTDKASILSLEPLQVNTFGHFTQLIAIIMIEGYRGRNKLTPLGLPAFWLMLIQYAGIGVAMPLYYLVYTLISDVE
ncbi:hydroxylase [Fusarium denticulatum]|uniref:Hydroxylase n=1 Tax=Fusarium denticulatum TaxID=48507 RepID=A0A8H5U990_9HYPO|nr:hydroxylase [Fusarium denticulatum]